MLHFAPECKDNSLNKSWFCQNIWIKPIHIINTLTALIVTVRVYISYGFMSSMYLTYTQLCVVTTYWKKSNFTRNSKEMLNLECCSFIRLTSNDFIFSLTFWDEIWMFINSELMWKHWTDDEMSCGSCSWCTMSTLEQHTVKQSTMFKLQELHEVQ